MLLREHQYVLALDTKANPPLAWRSYTTYRDFPQIEDAARRGDLPPRVIYEPTSQALRWLKDRDPKLADGDVSPIARMFRWVFGRGGMALYVDEVADMTPGPWWMPSGYEDCLRKGRARGLTVLSSTQSPINIPNYIMSEAEHNYIFFLKMAGQRKKVEEMTGVPEEKIWDLQKTQYIYSDQASHGYTKMRLFLGGVAG